MSQFKVAEFQVSGGAMNLALTHLSFALNSLCDDLELFQVMYSFANHFIIRHCSPFISQAKEETVGKKVSLAWLHILRDNKEMAKQNKRKPLKKEIKHRNNAKKGSRKYSRWRQEPKAEQLRWLTRRTSSWLLRWFDGRRTSAAPLISQQFQDSNSKSNNSAPQGEHKGTFCFTDAYISFLLKNPGSQLFFMFVHSLGFMSVSKSTRDLSLPHANTFLPQLLSKMKRPLKNLEVAHLLIRFHLLASDACLLRKDSKC
ncbi:hypothetical protein YC2023_069183 [Brassica napus]